MKKLIFIFILLLSLGHFLPTPSIELKTYRFQLPSKNPSQRPYDLVVIGNHLGEKFSKLIAKKLQKNVLNLAAKNHPLHMQLAKLKSYKQSFPQIIYLGNTSEFSSLRIRPEDYQTFLQGHAAINSPIKKKVTQLFPWSWPLFNKEYSAPVIYKNLRPQKIPKNKNSQKLQLKALTYLLYQNELQDLFRYTQKNKSHLLLVSTPHPFKVPRPLKCWKDQKLSPNLESSLEQLQASALTSSANARIQWLLAEKLLEKQRYRQSYLAYRKSVLFDCHLRKYDPIFNQILKKEASRFNITFYDLASTIHKSYLEKKSFSYEEVFRQELPNILSMFEKFIK